MNAFQAAVLAIVLAAASSPILAQNCPPGNKRVAPNSRYAISEPGPIGEQVVTDLVTGLMWKRTSEGFLAWADAIVEANELSFAGFDDWRLPNFIELRSLVESGCHSPAINTSAFPSLPGDFFWTSTSNATSPNHAWMVAFSDGGTASTVPKSQQLWVRLVRGGRSGSAFNSGNDFTPDAFAFTPQVDVPLADLRTSNTVTISGLTTPVGIAVSGEPGSQYSINSGTFTAAPGTVSNGDTVSVRHTSAAGYSTSVTTTLTIGAIGADFVTTTGQYPQIRLNDTGQIACYSAAAQTGTVAPGTPDPETAGFDEQDCTQGPAAADAVGVLSKTGASSVAGRDYTKIANNGSELAASATLGSGPTDWACTRDNVTGLIWEVKVNNVAHLRHQGHSYTWYDTDATINGGAAGEIGTATSCTSTLTNCNTSAFRDAVNTVGLCGANDWRMPDLGELQSLVSYAGSVVDVTWLPNTTSNRYWTSQTYAGAASLAWYVDFVLGNPGASNSKAGANSVRLVRGGL